MTPCTPSCTTVESTCLYVNSDFSAPSAHSSSISEPQIERFQTHRKVGRQDRQSYDTIANKIHRYMTRTKITRKPKFQYTSPPRLQGLGYIEENLHAVKLQRARNQHERENSNILPKSAQTETLHRVKTENPVPPAGRATERMKVLSRKYTVWGSEEFLW